MTIDSKAGNKRKRLILWGLGVMMILAIVIAAFILTRGSSDSASPVPVASTATPSVVPSMTPSQLPPSQLPTPMPGATDAVEPLPPVEVPFDQEAQPAPGVVVAMEGIEAVEGEPQGPGEVAGPALRATIKITNASDGDLRTLGAVANLYYGSDGLPASTVFGPGGISFPEVLGAGETASGSFVFTVPLAERGQIRVTLDLAASVPTTVFVGAGPS